MNTRPLSSYSALCIVICLTLLASHQKAIAIDYNQIPSYEDVYQFCSTGQSETVVDWLNQDLIGAGEKNLVLEAVIQVYQARAGEVEFVTLPSDAVSARHSLVARLLSFDIRPAIDATLAVSLGDLVLRFETESRVRRAALKYLRRSGKYDAWASTALDLAQDKNISMRQRVGVLIALSEEQQKDILSSGDADLSAAWAQASRSKLDKCREALMSIAIDPSSTWIF